MEQQSLATMRKKKILTDVSFVCEDGLVDAHRTILSANNDYFMKMFTSPMVEATQKEIKYTHTTVRAMSTLVSFVYGKEVLTKIENNVHLEEVLNLSHMTQTMDLFDQFWKLFLTRYMNVSNCISMWPVGELYNMGSSMYPYILANLKRINANNLNFGNVKIDHMKSFLLYVYKFWPNSVEIFKFIKQWRKDKDDRKAISNQLIKDYFSYFEVTKSNLFPGSVVDIKPVENVSKFEIFVFFRVFNHYCECKCECICEDDCECEYECRANSHELYQTIECYFNQCFNSKTEQWSKRQLPDLPVNSHWIPIMVNGELFYLSRLNENFQCYRRCANKTQIFTIESQTNGCIDLPTFVANQSMIYATSKHSIYTFNTEDLSWSCIWKSDNLYFEILTIIGFTDAGDCILLVKYYNRHLIYVFSSTFNVFLLKHKIASTIKYLPTKSLNGTCIEFCYFLNDDNQLFSYHMESNKWYSQAMPDYPEKEIIVICSCEFPFILFRERDNYENLWLYHLRNTLWEKIPSVSKCHAFLSNEAKIDIDAYFSGVL